MGFVPDTLLGHGLGNKHEHPVDGSAGMQGVPMAIRSPASLEWYLTGGATFQGSSPPPCAAQRKAQTQLQAAVKLHRVM